MEKVLKGLWADMVHQYRSEIFFFHHVAYWVGGFGVGSSTSQVTVAVWVLCPHCKWFHGKANHPKHHSTAHPKAVGSNLRFDTVGNCLVVRHHHVGMRCLDMGLMPQNMKLWEVQVPLAQNT